MRAQNNVPTKASEAVVAAVRQSVPEEARGAFDLQLSKNMTRVRTKYGLWSRVTGDEARRVAFLREKLAEPSKRAIADWTPEPQLDPFLARAMRSHEQFTSYAASTQPLGSSWRW